MTSSFVTVVVPFDDALADGVLPLVQAMGNPAAAPLRCALGALGILHFMSLNVIRAGDGGGDGGDAAHLLLELSADGPAEPALQAVAGAIAPELTAVLDAAGHPLRRPAWPASWRATAGRSLPTGLARGGAAARSGCRSVVHLAWRCGASSPSAIRRPRRRVVRRPLRSGTALDTLSGYASDCGNRATRNGHSPRSRPPS